jgi:hypothetical protein
MPPKKAAAAPAPAPEVPAPAEPAFVDPGPDVDVARKARVAAAFRVFDHESVGNVKAE